MLNIKQEQDLLPNSLISAIEGLNPEFRRLLQGSKDKEIICEYLKSVRNEINMSVNYRKLTIKTLTYLSRSSNKKFKEMRKEDIILFLNSLRKSETIDPLNRWISTYDLYLVVLQRFFKWLYHPDLSAKERSKLKPACVDIDRLNNIIKSVYKPTDMWSQEDDLLFFKYCPSKRDRCYHAISRDSSCRPHELLKVKIKDIVFKMAGDRQYAEILVNGKTGQRHIPLINSIPYLKDWLGEHPQSGNENAVLICGFNKSLGRPIRIETLNHIYENYRKIVFPKLLEDRNIPPEDKAKIRGLLNKPWNPYVRRHTGLTEKSKVLKEHVLRQHAGWSSSSNMHQKYIHYFGNESNESILEAYGLKNKLEETDKLKPTPCPNCSESNKPGSKFCSKCRMVLSYDAYTETIKEQTRKEEQVRKIKEIETLNVEAITALSDRLTKALEDIELLKQGK